MIDFLLGYQYNREKCIRISFETTNNGLNQRIERTTIFLPSQSKREIGLLLCYTLILTQRLWFEKNIYLFKANGYPVALRSAIDSNTTL